MPQAKVKKVGGKRTKLISKPWVLRQWLSDRRQPDDSYVTGTVEHSGGLLHAAISFHDGQNVVTWQARIPHGNKDAAKPFLRAMAALQHGVKEVCAKVENELEKTL